MLKKNHIWGGEISLYTSPQNINVLHCTVSIEGGTTITLAGLRACLLLFISIAWGRWDQYFTKERKKFNFQFSIEEVTRKLHFWKDYHVFSVIAENTLQETKADITSKDWQGAIYYILVLGLIYPFIFKPGLVAKDHCIQLSHCYGISPYVCFFFTYDAPWMSDELGRRFIRWKQHSGYDVFPQAPITPLL